MNDQVTIKREINEKTVEIPCFWKLPDGMYKLIIEDNRFEIYYSLSTCEYYALSKEDRDDDLPV